MVRNEKRSWPIYSARPCLVATRSATGFTRTLHLERCPLKENTVVTHRLSGFSISGCEFIGALQTSLSNRRMRGCLVRSRLVAIQMPFSGEHLRPRCLHRKERPVEMCSESPAPDEIRSRIREQIMTSPLVWSLMHFQLTGLSRCSPKDRHGVLGTPCPKVER